MKVKEHRSEDAIITKKICEACGHEHVSVYSHGLTESGEDFIQLGTTTCFNHSKIGPEVRLFACPKCGTVQILMEKKL